MAKSLLQSILLLKNLCKNVVPIMGKKRKAQNNPKDDDNADKKIKEKKKKEVIVKDINTANENDNVTSEQSFSDVKPVVKNSGKPSKIIFVDDKPQEVPVTSLNTKKNIAPKKIKQQKNDTFTEEDVKDEDIDNFCDELDEEDNKQYEHWVQLIEANFNSNKKKQK